MVNSLPCNAVALIRKFILAMVVLVVAGLPVELMAQCAQTTFSEGGTVNPNADAGYGSVNVGSGTWLTANVHNGGLYTFSTCNSNPAGWGTNDAQITGFNLGSTALFYNDDNGPVCAGAAASVQWSATSTSAINVQTNRFNCAGWQGGGATNSALLEYRCDGPGDPSVYGSNTWNLYAYNDGDAAGGSGAWSTAYSGYMILGSALSFNSQTFWTVTGSPSDNGLFLGCAVGYDNYSWTAKRRGFPCGVYSIDVPAHDDRYELYVDGTLVGFHSGSGDSHTNVWTGTLLSTSTVEFRVSEGGGNSNGAITFNLVTPVLDGGLIASAQTICTGGDPAAFTSTTAATGGAGGYSYNWYYQDNCAGAATFAGSGLTYDAPALTNTRCYYRIVTDVCGTDDPSDVVTITVTADPTVSASGATTICAGGSANLSASPSGGTGCSTVTWESSVNGVSSWTSTGLSGNNVTVSPASTLYYRAVYACSGNGCNPNPATSAAQLVTVNPVATANAGTPQGVCQGSSIVLAGSIGGAAVSSTWSAPSGIFSDATSLTSTYTPAVSTGPVTLTLTTNDPSGPCAAVASTVVVTVSPAATANAGFPQTICEGGTVNLGGAIGGTATSSTWSAPSGSFSDVNSLLSTYTPSITSGTVTLTLTTNDPDGAGPCNGAVSTVVITVGQQPSANAGLPQTVCGGGSITLAGVIGGSATSSTWTSGTGSFSNINSLTSTYTPSISSGTVNLTLTTNDPDGAGPCVAAVSTMAVTVNLAPTANAGFPQTTCEGGTVNLGGGIGGSATSSTWSAPSGSFSDATSLTSSYTPSITSGNVTLTLTTNDPDGAGPCVGAVSTVVITVNQAPTANAGAPQTVCGGGTITLAGSIGGSATSSTWTSGTGSFSNINSLTSTYTPSIASGTVTLNLASNDPDGAGPCVAATSNVVVTVNLAPIASAGFPQTTCEGGTVNLGGSIGGSAVSSTWSAPSGSFTDATSLTSSYTPSITSGTVTLTLTTNDPDGAGPCTGAVSTVVITVNPAATADAGLPQTVCGGSSITLSGSVGGSATSSTWTSGTGSFSNINSLTSTYSPSIASGTVTLTLTSNDPDGAGPCAAAVSTVLVTVNLAPTANAGVPQTTCEGGTVTLSGGIGGSAVSSTWSAPSGSFSSTSSLGATYTPSITSGSVTLTLTTDDPDGAGPCSPAVSAIVITVNPAATANAGTTQTVCQAGTVTLAGSVGGSATNSTWSAPTGSFSNINSLTSTYSPSITSGNVTLTLTTNDPDGVGPCQPATSIVVITVTPLPDINSVTQTDVSCFGGGNGSISISASNGTPPLSYSIDNGVTTQSSNLFSNLSIGSYTIVVSDGQTCSRPYALNPVVITQPAVLDHTTIITDASCSNVFDGKIDVTATGGTVPYSYSLNGGPAQVGSSFTGLQSGAYVVYVFDGKGCQDTSHVIINDSYNVSSFIVSQTDVSCFGGSNGAVIVQIVGGTPGFSYSINGNIFQGSPIFTGLAAGNYVVVLRDSKGCTAYQSVTIGQPAQLSAIIDVVNNVTCNNTPTGEIFMTVNGGTTPYSYLWSNGDTLQDADTLLAGTYTVTITDAKGCTTFSGATVTQPVALFVNVASYHDLKCFNDSTGTIDITVSGGVPSYTYVWSNGAATEDLSTLHAGTYAVTVSDNNLCQKVVTQIIGEPVLLSSTILGSNVSCSGVSNGTIDLTVSGGSLPYTYFWSNATTNEDLTGVIAGTYSVVVTDAHGCVITNSTTISQPTGLGLTTSITNVLCNGNSTGAIDLTVTGGTPTYTYFWSNSASSQDLTGLTSGTYTVIVTDVNLCSASLSVSVTQPAQALSGTLVATAVTCNGSNNGSVNLTVTGGTQPYTYGWSDLATSEDISGLSGNTYSVTVTDANGCLFIGSSLVTEPAALSATISGTDVSCFGGNNGAADLTVTGGNPSYTYLWSTFASTEDLTLLTAGNYVVVVNDTKGCQTIASITISQPAQIAVSGIVTNVSCNGLSNGAIDLTATGGVGTLTYAWSNSTSSEDQSTLTAGTYSVLVIDGSGCTASASFTVTQPTPLTLSGISTNVNCNGNANGTINISVSGGTTAYTYIWDNNTATEDQGGLSGGAYSVTVTDAHACTVSATYTIIEPTAITTSFLASDVTCHGANNGAVDLTVNGGVPGYTYIWTNGSATQDLSGIAGGNYTVVVRDANGCSVVASQAIAEPSAITTVVAVTNISCNGLGTGSIDLSVSGGAGSYTYLWNNSATSEDISNLGAGLYSVVVTDANACTVSASATISQPSQPISATAVATDVTCNGANNGSVNLTPVGGVQPYTFLWSNNATTEDLSGLGAGTYTVDVRDANGCSATASAAVSEPLVLTASIAGANVSCFGGNNGTADLTVSGGNSPYTYLWSNFATTEDLSSLTAGNYVVIVTDAKGCQKITSVSIIQPTPVIVSGTVVNLSCYNAGDGFIDINVSGGTPGYTFAWSNSSSSEDQSNIVSGTYTVTVFDANLCTATATFVVTQPNAISITGTVTNINCSGASTGAVNITVAGGTAPYSYSWSNGALTEDLSGLTAGPYFVVVTDANFCTASALYNVTQPAALTATVTGTNVLCHGANTGAVDLTVTGGVPGYTYIWTNGAITEDLSGLTGGTYTVVVHDANGCSAVASQTISEPAAITISVATTNVRCNGGVDGGVDITVNGGTPTITYVWSNQATTQDLTGVAAGTYSVVITDGNGCTASASATVTEPSGLVLNSTVTGVLCAGVASGSVDITVQGGIFPYTYAWSNNATSEDIHNVTGGNYSVIVTDANGCTTSASFTVSQPAAFSAAVTGTDVLCHGANTGAVDLIVTGGVPAYTYIWTNGAITEDLSGLAGGTYTVVVHDANGCSVVASKTITEPAAITISVATTNVQCNGVVDGGVDITVNGGTPTITYVWSNQATTQDLTGVAAGTYSVVITDGNGCTASASATVTAPSGLVLNSTVTGVLCAGVASGSVDITVQGGIFPYTYAWSNNATSEDIHNVTGGNYSVIVTDANGCTTSASFTVSQPAAFSTAVTGTDVLCHGTYTGAVDLTVTGGVPAYTYIWTNGSITEDLSGLAGGTYTVVVHDANGCSAVASKTITEPAAITISVATTNVQCNGGVDGGVDITVNGGTPTITYVWSNQATTQDLTGVAAGTYSVVITDGNGCTASASATVTQALPLTVIGNATDVRCANGHDGIVNISVGGGTAPYTYSWDNGAVTEDIQNLDTGSYTVVVTDFTQVCTASATFIIGQPTPMLDTVSGVSVACQGSNSGSAQVTVSGGVLPYTFFWSNFQGSDSIRNLDGGTYYVLITDGNGCTKRDSIIITEPSPFIITVDSAFDIRCFSDTNGRVYISVTGGTPSYSYLWSNGATTVDSAVNLTDGFYVVTVTDGNGCKAYASSNIARPSRLTINAFVSRPLCSDSTNGKIDLIPTGGTPSYHYFWSNSDSSAVQIGTDTTEDISNIGRGIYIAIVTDSRGCSTTDSILVTEPGPFYISEVVKQPSCHGFSDGYIDITSYGGTLPYGFQWNNGTTTEDQYNIPGDSLYSVIALDANGCSAVYFAYLADPAKLVVNAKATPVACFGGNTGTLTGTATGGVPGKQGYHFLWSNFDTASSIANVIAGHYVLQVTDSNGCFNSDTADVVQPNEISIAGNVTNETCFGGLTGGIDITVSGGIPTFTFNWSTGSTSEDLVNVSAGTDTVTVMDLNGCLKTAIFTITQPTAIYLTFLSNQPSCHGSTNGSLAVVATQGNPAYTYSWNTTPAQTTASAENLKAGDYSVTVTDIKGCTVAATQTLVEPVMLDVVATDTASKCFNTDNGKVIVTATGGLEPYIYELNGLTQLSNTFNAVGAGNYLVVVTDRNGCEGTDTFSIQQASQIAVDLTTSQQVILTGMETQLYTTVTPVQALTNIVWSPLVDSTYGDIFDFNGCDPLNCGSPYVHPRYTTTFTVKVTNKDGCSVSDTLTIEVKNEAAKFVPTAFTPNGDGLNDRFEFDVLGATKLDVTVYNRWGEVLFHNDNQENGMNHSSGWDGTKNGKICPFDTYVYSIKITYFDNSVVNVNGTVTLMK